MVTIFVTGLSGVGKSSLLQELEKDGFEVVDTDYGYVKVVEYEGIQERVLDEEKLTRLLEQPRESSLIISGCYSNQGKFYPHFDHVVLLKADLDVMLERIEARTTHHYGKSSEERAEVIDSFENVLPLLEKGSDISIDTSHISIMEVSKQLKNLVEPL